MSEPTPQPSASPAPAPVPAPVPSTAPAAPVPAPESAPAAPPPMAVPPSPAPNPAPLRRSFLEPSSVRPTVIVAIIIAALFYGTQILNEALPAAASEVPVSAGGTVAIGRGALITPLDGWVASAHDGSDGIRLEKGIVAVDLWADASSSSAVELAEAYRDQALATDTTQFTATTIETTTSGNGTSAAVFRYQGVFTGIDVAIEGEVTVVFHDGLGVISDAWTRQGDLDDSLREIHAMVESIELPS